MYPDFFPIILQKKISEVIDKTDIKTPIILISVDVLRNNYEYFKQTLNICDNNYFFAVKSNNNINLINELKNLGSGFEIASSGELNLMKFAKVSAEKIIFSNPVKIPGHIAEAYNYGVKTFAFDTESELHKISMHAPKSNVFLRLSVKNTGSDWQLTDKFGADKDKAVQLFKHALRYGLIPAGVCFHVGWNNTNLQTWKQAVNLASEVVEDCEKQGICLKFLNLGGGFPAHRIEQYSALKKIADTINPIITSLKKRFRLSIYAEPGTYMIANTAVMLTQIYDIIERNHKKWIFTDSGICQGFYWIHAGLNYDVIYPYKISENTEFEKFIITGPTCDSHDIFSEEAFLPKNIKIGDILAIYPAGAYVSSSGEYNGFAYPETSFI